MILYKRKKHKISIKKNPKIATELKAYLSPQILWATFVVIFLTLPTTSCLTTDQTSLKDTGGVFSQESSKENVDEKTRILKTQEEIEQTRKRLETLYKKWLFGKNCEEIRSTGKEINEILSNIELDFPFTATVGSYSSKTNSIELLFDSGDKRA
ncbi:MAG: hypothetical protein ACK419_03260, partial [Pyrinomonadaceae bacterium]